MLSVPHLVIIFLIALIVFGPEKLPDLARNFGKAMSEFKRATGDLRAGFEEHMRELERETTMRQAQRPRAAQPNPIPSPLAAAPALPHAESAAIDAAPSAVESEIVEGESVSAALGIAAPEIVPEKASDGRH